MKKSDFKTFTLKTITGDEVRITCYTYTSGYYWGHRAYNEATGDEVKITYYNRTWEGFKYESVLYKAVRALYPQEKRQASERAFMYKQLQAIADGEAQACEAWAQAFIKSFNALSEKTRERIKNSDIVLNTIEQGDALIKIGQLCDAMDALK